MTRIFTIKYTVALLFPSWRLFDRAPFEFQIEVFKANGFSTDPQWAVLPLAPERFRLLGFLFQPKMTEWHFLNSLVDRLANDFSQGGQMSSSTTALLREVLASRCKDIGLRNRPLRIRFLHDDSTLDVP